MSEPLVVVRWHQYIFWNVPCCTGSKKHLGLIHNHDLLYAHRLEIWLTRLLLDVTSLIVWRRNMPARFDRELFFHQCLYIHAFLPLPWGNMLCCWPDIRRSYLVLGPELLSLLLWCGRSCLIIHLTLCHPMLLKLTWGWSDPRVLLIDSPLQFFCAWLGVIFKRLCSVVVWEFCIVVELTECLLAALPPYHLFVWLLSLLACIPKHLRARITASLFFLSRLILNNLETEL